MLAPFCFSLRTPIVYDEVSLKTNEMADGLQTGRAAVKTSKEVIVEAVICLTAIVVAVFSYAGNRSPDHQYKQEGKDASQYHRVPGSDSGG